MKVIRIKKLSRKGRLFNNNRFTSKCVFRVSLCLLYALADILNFLSFFILNTGVLLLDIYLNRAVEAVKHIRAKLQRKRHAPISTVILKAFIEEN
jgi:hypothetical protein